MAQEKHEIEADKLSGPIVGVTLTPFLTPFLKKLLNPTAELLGNELRDIIKEPIEKWKAKRKEENLRKHLEGVNMRIREKTSQNIIELKITIREANFFSEWAELVQDIDPEDSELSQIWQHLMARVALGEEISAELLRVLKGLTPGEARFLLQLQQPNWKAIIWRWPLFPMESRTDRFYLRSLQQKQLIEHSTFGFVLSACTLFALSGYWGYSLYVHKSWHWVPMQEKVTRFVYVFAILACVFVPLFILATNLIHWRLSWLGRELTRFAEKDTATNTNKHGKV